MAAIRTDLAMEAHALCRETGASQLQGVIAREETLNGFPLTRVEIVDKAGEQALGKPQIGRAHV